MDYSNLNKFCLEVEITYRDDKYKVRDNGAVCRLGRPGKRLRRIDDRWTSGRECPRSGYLFIGPHPVHRIVATAFLGEPPSDQHVVDHISRRKKNNRPENLRWLTKAENLTENTLTRQLIERQYGTVENFLELLSQGGQSTNKPNIANERERAEREVSATIDSLTPGATQRHWQTPCEFPQCPSPDIVDCIAATDTSEYGDEYLLAYLENLTPENVFARNRYGEQKIAIADLSFRSAEISVICELNETSLKPFGLVMITFENGKFVHHSKATFFEYDGAIREHCELTGLPLSNYGDVSPNGIDSFC